MTVEEVYTQAKALSVDDQHVLFVRLMEEVLPEPPNTFESESKLEEMLIEGLNGPFSEPTPEVWDMRLQRLRDRGSAK